MIIINKEYRKNNAKPVNAMISILMPIFNGIEYIDESIASVLAQTIGSSRWELLIGINGHAANSAVFQKANTYACENIRVFDYPHIQGKSATLNTLITECRYNYVALLDVDDIWMPNKLLIQSIYLELDYDVVGTTCVYIGDFEGVIPKLPVGDLATFDFKRYNPVINSSVVLKKSLCFWDSKWDGIEDYELWLRLSQQKRTFFNCFEVFVKHRIHRDSAFNSKNQTERLQQLKALYSPGRDVFI